MNFIFSPFIVPLGAFVVAIVAIASGIYGQVQKRRVIAEQRMAMLARGLPLAEIEAVLSRVEEQEEKPVRDPMRKLGNARRAAIVLISTGLGIMGFFAVLWLVLQERDVLVGIGIGFIPLAIGLGFVVDYRMQKREMSRFGLEVGE